MPDPLDPDPLYAAYCAGWFPMADETGEVSWYQPRRRALFPLEGMRVSRSLARFMRRNLFEIRFDTAFESVVRGCLRPDANWITEEIIEAYVRVHRAGWAHCVECWQEGELAGGAYGLALGGCFSAESMFHRTNNASKVALWALIGHCRAMGFTLFDAQVMNPHLASLGAYEVAHQEYLDLLGAALRISTPWSRNRAAADYDLSR